MSALVSFVRPDRALCVWCTVLDRTKVGALVATFFDFLMAFFVLPHYYVPAAITAACFLPVFILLGFAPSRVIIGDDGVQWHHFIPFVSPTFLSYGEIHEILPSPRGCSIVCMNGRTVNLYTSTAAPRGIPMLGTSAISRASAWRMKLRDEPLFESAPPGSAPYRSSEDAAALLTIAAMPHAPSEARIAAAKRLVARVDPMDEELRATLNAVALSSAEPTVRSTFQEFARGARVD